MTDDADRPRPVTPGEGDEGPATEAFRWSPEAADAAGTQVHSWNLAADDDPTHAFARHADASLTADADQAPVDPSLDGAPGLDGQPPTEAMAWETGVVPKVAPGGPLPRTQVPAEPTGPSGIDALFQPGRFRDFEPTTVLPREPALVGATAVRGTRTRPSMTPAQRSLLWAAGVLVAILVLLALFAIGRRLPALFAAPPTPVATATPTPTPTEEAVDPADGPQPPGEYAWDELRGGECLEPYESAWQEDYTVVDCGGPHAAELLIRAEFPEDAESDAYPGFDELAGSINLLCTDPKVVDYTAAREFDDIVLEGAHAVTPEEWEDGHRDYFCFVTRSSREPLTETLARPREG